MGSPDRIRDYDLEIRFSLTCFKCARYREAGEEHPKDAAEAFARAGWVAVNGEVLCPPCKNKMETEQ